MLECMISVDNYLNETTRHAHVILPGLSPLEQPHFDELLWGWAARSGGNWSPIRSSRRPPTGPHEWEILTRLGGAAARACTNADIDVDAIDDGWFAALCRCAGPRRRRTSIAALRRAAVRSGSLDLHDPHRTVGRPLRRGARRADAARRSRTQPHGIDMGPMVPARREMVCTPVGQDRPRAGVHRRRRAAPREHGSRESRRRPRAGQPPAPALEQLVDAQREGAGEGQGPLHAARPPRRRRAARARRRRSRPRQLRGRHASRCRSR